MKSIGRDLVYDSRTLLTTPGPYCLIFPNFPTKQVYLVCLICQEAQTSPWAGRWTVTLILQVLTIWTNSASQVVICLFLLSFAFWNFHRQRAVEPLWGTLRPSLCVLLQVLCTQKTWSIFWFYNINSRGCRLISGEKVLEMGAKTERTQSKERWSGVPWDHWVPGSFMSVVVWDYGPLEGRGHFCLVHWHISLCGVEAAVGVQW